MGFKKYYIKLLLLVIFVSISGAITIWGFIKPEFFISRFILLFIWIFLIYLLFNYIYKTTRIIKDFISNIKEGDFVFLPDSKNVFGTEFNELILSLNNRIKTIRIEKEEQYHLFKTAVNQSGSGIIVFDSNGNIELYNKAATSIFALKKLTAIQSLNAANPELPIKLLHSKDNSFIIGIQAGNELQKLAIHQNDFVLRGRKLKVASIQNISNELDKEELEAWKKLMHVITHEIMNSVTPMKTLSYSLFDIYNQNNQPVLLKKLKQHHIEDTYIGLKALNNRVNGLMKFVDSYRKLYKIPDPIFSNLMFSEIIDEIQPLFKNTFDENNIKLNIIGNYNVSVFADREMLTQVFINLIKNAIDALKESSNPEITITISQKINETIISVKDNGHGIDENIMRDIFVPFYTTKKEGSGIGLYYCKMIVFLHKGKIAVSSKLNEGTTFTIHL